MASQGGNKINPVLRSFFNTKGLFAAKVSVASREIASNCSKASCSSISRTNKLNVLFTVVQQLTVHPDVNKG